MRTVKVIPVPGGWLVECDAAAPIVFRSGAAAEQKAKELGRLLALDNQAQVLIHDRQGALVGSTVLGYRRSAADRLTQDRVAAAKGVP